MHGTPNICNMHIQYAPHTMHEIHTHEMVVPVNYSIICLHQIDDKESEGFCTITPTKKNHKVVIYGHTSLWTIKEKTDNTESGFQLL